MTVARVLADELRGRCIGAIEPEDVARTLAIEVTYSRLGAPLLGMTLGPNKVAVERKLDDPVRRFTLAHEIGHILVRRGRVPTFTRSLEEELFADRFARALMLPTNELRQPVAVSRLCRKYQVPRRVALVQLAEAGHRPRLTRDTDGTVLCIQCGDRAGNPACECLTYRQRPERGLPGTVPRHLAH